MDQVTDGMPARASHCASALPAPAALDYSTRASEEAANLAALWMELIQGSCKIEAGFFTEHACTIGVTRAPLGATASATKRITQRDIEVLEQALLNGGRKSLALDFGLCASSVAEILKRCFAFMGLPCWPSRIPLVLVMAAHAKDIRENARAAKLLSVENQQFRQQTFSAVRPDAELAGQLSQAEYDVARLLVEGFNYDQIASVRGTSPRTVANQVAAAFARLGVSGRAELLCFLAKRRAVLWRSQATLRPLSLVTPIAPTTHVSFARVAGDRR